jgi:hypothetical protein
MAPTLKCPGGHYIVENEKGPGVYCGIEARFLSVMENPRSVMGFCSGEYTKCPAWIADKEDDPAVLAAQGKPRLTRCRICQGTGISKVLEERSGFVFPNELACDECAGTGRVVWHKDDDKDE